MAQVYFPEFRDLLRYLSEISQDRIKTPTTYNLLPTKAATTARARRQFYPIVAALYLSDFGLKIAVEQFVNKC